MDITAQEQPEVFVTHSGAIVQTTGDVLDPVYTIQEVEFDPEKYLRDFDNGERDKVTNVCDSKRKK